MEGALTWSNIRNMAKNKAAQQMARARAASLTPERRREIARKAALARWKKPKKS
jgi:hypothetical protein